MPQGPGTAMGPKGIHMLEFCYRFFCQDDVDFNITHKAWCYSKINYQHTISLWCHSRFWTPLATKIGIVKGLLLKAHKMLEFALKRGEWIHGNNTHSNETITIDVGFFFPIGTFVQHFKLFSHTQSCNSRPIYHVIVILDEAHGPHFA